MITTTGALRLNIVPAREAVKSVSATGGQRG